MKIISIGTDRKLFEENSAVRQRQIAYGKMFEELHLIVFTPSAEKFKLQKLSDNVFLYPTKSKVRGFFVFDFLIIIKKILQKIGTENVVLTCQDPFEVGFIGTLAKLFFNLPLHIQIHTDFAGKYFREFSLLNKIRFLLAEFVLKYSDRVRVVSDRIKKSIEIFSKNVDVLPIFAGIKERGNEAASEIKKPFPFTLLLVCRLEKEKNIETVFEALKNIKDQNVGICLVGDGSQRKSLAALANNLKISERVIFTGWQDNLAAYYKMADVFVSASFYEGYGVSTVEAAYFGKPLILSDTGIAGEIFSIQDEKQKGSCFVCDLEVATDFTNKISKLYQDKNLAREMGERAKIEAEQHLNSVSNYFKEYANSILKTKDNFKKKNFVTRVYDFKKTAFHSFVYLRYFICGVTAAAINIFLLYIFTDKFKIWYLFSSALAFLISLVVSFVLQKFLVFKDTKIDGIHYQFSIFFVAAILGMATNTVLVFLSTDVLGIWYIISQVIAGFFVMIQNFLLYKFFIFNKR